MAETAGAPHKGFPGAHSKPFSVMKAIVVVSLLMGKMEFSKGGYHHRSEQTSRARIKGGPGRGGREERGERREEITPAHRVFNIWSFNRQVKCCFSQKPA
jgi:hypothetical protein